LGAGGGGERGLEVDPMRIGERTTVAAAFGAVWVIWGSTYLAIAWAVETIPPMLMIGVRCVVAGAALYGWARMRGGPRPRAEHWRDAALAGFLLFVTGQAVLAWAETRIPSGAASLLIATEPLFITLLAWRGGSATGSAAAAPGLGGMLAILAGFAGVAVLALPGVGGGGLDPLGAAAAVLASLSWSVGVFRAGSRSGIPAGQTAGMQLLVAGVVLLAISALTGEMGAVPVAGPSVRSLAALAYLVVFGSLVAFGAYVWLLDRVGAARLSTHAYVNPLVAVVLGSMLNREPVTAGLVGATALILGSVVLLLRPRAPAPQRAGRRRLSDTLHRRHREARRVLVLPERRARVGIEQPAVGVDRARLPEEGDLERSTAPTQVIAEPVPALGEELASALLDDVRDHVVLRGQVRGGHRRDARARV
jgi:drug/metabolite transporter (DMT)-like permease